MYSIVSILNQQFLLGSEFLLVLENGSCVVCSGGFILKGKQKKQQIKIESGFGLFICLAGQ